jgi:hypothetical protein
MAKSISFATTLDLAEPPPQSDLLLGCISEEALAAAAAANSGQNYVIDYDFYQGAHDNVISSGAFPGKRPLRPSVSEPEGLARRDSNPIPNGKGPHHHHHHHSHSHHHSHEDHTDDVDDPMPHILPSPAFCRQHSWEAKRPVRNITVIEQITTSV